MLDFRIATTNQEKLHGSLHDSMLIGPSNIFCGRGLEQPNRLNTQWYFSDEHQIRKIGRTNKEQLTGIKLPKNYVYSSGILPQQ